MSRRKKSPTKTPTGTDVHFMHGELPLKCPYNHDLGAIVITRTTIFRLTRDQFEAFRDGKTITDSKPVTPGETIGELCFFCKQLRPRDKCWYEQPWDVGEPHLDYELAATNPGNRSLTLKPPTLC
jgi:hypothetical protein